LRNDKVASGIMPRRLAQMSWMSPARHMRVSLA